MSKIRLFVAALAICCFATIAQAQYVPTVISYNGPLGDSPGILTGPNWPAITHSTIEDFDANTTWVWLMDSNGMGSIYALDRTGDPDYIVLKIGQVLNGLREVRISRFKNGVRISITGNIYLPHVQNPNFP